MHRQFPDRGRPTVLTQSFSTLETCVGSLHIHVGLQEICKSDMLIKKTKHWQTNRVSVGRRQLNYKTKTRKNKNNIDTDKVKAVPQLANKKPLTFSLRSII